MFSHLALVGATGAVGGLIRRLLEERNYPFERITFLASARSAGQKLAFRGTEHTVQLLRPEAFDDIDLCLASTPDDVARDFIPDAVRRGTLVVDESGAWRMDPTVPLVVPEVNPTAVDGHRGLIASPNCSTTQMVVAMKPLHDFGRIRRVVVSTYQATSGAGVAGQRDLTQGTHAFLHNQAYEYETFKHPIAFNLIPQIGSPKQDGYTSEEIKMVLETRKIFGDESLRICPTCVRVPVSNCHSESILVETDRKISAAKARELFHDAAGISLIDNLDAGEYPMPMHCNDSDDVFIGRIREDLSCDNGLSFWCVSDNLRKGAATNAVQIAELLIERGLSAKRK
ncbi:MAG: aspartate-semialdehyde dehydrogenase [Planctomycetota bacterium]|nr:aspartate-semialdehyde dehydrogenase [Planctomycetota bacterium]MDA1177921.1 aspartate-semialdehyde dehydrogenase [Planctomycetota bacterium]